MLPSGQIFFITLFSHSLSHYLNSVSGHGNASSDGLKENNSFIFSLPPNKEMGTQAHKPLEIPQIHFSQSVKSQKMYAHIFTFHRRISQEDFKASIRFSQQLLSLQTVKNLCLCIPWKHSRHTFSLPLLSQFPVSKSGSCHHLWDAFPDHLTYNWFP